MVSQTEVIDAVNAAATSFGVDGAELEQLLGYVASVPANEYRDFTSPVAGVQDPKAILELVRSRLKAQGVASGSQHSASITAVPAAGAPAPTAPPYVDMAMLKDLLAEEARLQKNALAEQARLQNEALARLLAEQARSQMDALAEQARLQNDALARSLAEQARSLKDALAEQARSLTAKMQEIRADNAPRRHHPNWAAPRREWAMSKAAVPKEKKVL